MRVVNRKARHEYHILDSLEAGIVLSGFEVKSVKLGRVDLSDSFARIENGEVVIKNIYIHPFQPPPRGFSPNSDRRLLLRRQQINALIGKVSKSAITLVPLSVYTKHNLIKVELALAASKKKFDKRRALKEKDLVRRVERDLEGL